MSSPVPLTPENARAFRAAMDGPVGDLLALETLRRLATRGQVAAFETSGQRSAGSFMRDLSSPGSVPVPAKGRTATVGALEVEERPGGHLWGWRRVAGGRCAPANLTPDEVREARAQLARLP